MPKMDGEKWGVLLPGRWEQEESKVSAVVLGGEGLMDGSGRAWRPCGEGRAARERK